MAPAQTRTCLTASRLLHELLPAAANCHQHAPGSVFGTGALPKDMALVSTLGEGTMALTRYDINLPPPMAISVFDAPGGGTETFSAVSYVEDSCLAAFDIQVGVGGSIGHRGRPTLQASVPLTAPGSDSFVMRFLPSSWPAISRLTILCISGYVLHSWRRIPSGHC